MTRALLALARYCVPLGVRGEGGRAWVSVHRRAGYVDIDTHGLPRPLSAAEARHLARRLDAAADAIDPPASDARAA